MNSRLGKSLRALLSQLPIQTSSGVAAGLGLIVFKRPKRFLIHNTGRVFVSEEFVLSGAEDKVNEL